VRNNNQKTQVNSHLPPVIVNETRTNADTTD
jgi:hypothetical protein